MSYATVRDEDLGQRATVPCSLPPHRLDGVHRGARRTRRDRKYRRKPRGMESSHGLDVVDDGQEKGVFALTIDRSGFIYWALATASRAGTMAEREISRPSGASQTTRGRLEGGEEEEEERGKGLEEL